MKNKGIKNMYRCSCGKPITDDFQMLYNIFDVCKHKPDLLSIPKKEKKL